ncbi:hypothetical protein AJ87_08955 [Rhizobium yanglingense]|nr:hypothetical protein AJ87_08955 [Rhizobium yanglingense]
MGEPGTAGRSLPDEPAVDRLLQHRARDGAHAGQVVVSARALAQQRAGRPPCGDVSGRPARRARPPCWLQWLNAGQSSDCGQRCPKISGLKEADQGKDVALAVRQWIEPAPSLVGDDDDVTAAPEFDGAARALLQIDLKTSLLQGDGAGDPLAQPLDIFSLHVQCPFRPSDCQGSFRQPRRPAAARARCENEQRRDNVRGEASLAADGAPAAKTRQGWMPAGGRPPGLPLRRQPRPEGRRPSIDNRQDRSKKKARHAVFGLSAIGVRRGLRFRPRPPLRRCRE